VSQASAAKRQREKARQEKAAAKSARREERRQTAGEAKPETSAAEQSALLEELAALHARFEAGEMDFDEFAAAKEELTQRLSL
jgi:hypothetical protein